MKQVKTLADIEAMLQREREAWFAERFDTWLPKYTNDAYGIHLLKKQMVNLGYKWECQCDGKKYWFAFRKRTSSFVYEADTEIEATWKAAALALLGE